MAAEVMVARLGQEMRDYIGTAEEMAATITPELAIGSTYWSKVDKAGFVFDGTEWCALT